jgi:hypothetical protein
MVVDREKLANMLRERGLRLLAYGEATDDDVGTYGTHYDTTSSLYDELTTPDVDGNVMTKRSWGTEEEWSKEDSWQNGQQWFFVRPLTPKSSPNKKIWQTHGLSDHDMVLADLAMGMVLPAFKKVGPDIIQIVVAEAKFQAFELPDRDSSFQREHAWKGKS